MVDAAVKDILRKLEQEDQLLRRGLLKNVSSKAIGSAVAPTAQAPEEVELHHAKAASAADSSGAPELDKDLLAC